MYACLRDYFVRSCFSEVEVSFNFKGDKAFIQSVCKEVTLAKYSIQEEKNNSDDIIVYSYHLPLKSRASRPIFAVLRPV